MKKKEYVVPSLKEYEMKKRPMLLTGSFNGGLKAPNRFVCDENPDPLSDI